MKSEVRRIELYMTFDNIEKGLNIVEVVKRSSKQLLKLDKFEIFYRYGMVLENEHCIIEVGLKDNPVDDSYVPFVRCVPHDDMGLDLCVAAFHIIAKELLHAPLKEINTGDNRT